MSALRCLLPLAVSLSLTASAPAATVRGVVARVDPDKKQLELEGRGHGLHGAMLLFTLAPDAAVTFGDQPGTLVDVTVGRRVRVEFEADGDHQIALSIQILGGPRPAGPIIAAPPTATPAAGDALTGVLRHIGYSDREVVLIGPGAKGPETETTVAVPEAARIVKDGKEVKLDDLKEGDAAAVQVEKKDGRASALSIQVGAGAAPAVAEKPASKMIPRLRMLLKVADQVLQNMQDRDRQP